MLTTLALVAAAFAAGASYQRSSMFRRISHKLFGSRKKKIVSGVLVASLAIAGGAYAFYAAQITASASNSAPIGANSNAPLDVTAQLSVSVPTGLTPGQTGNATVSFNNTTGKDIQLNAITNPVITTSDPANCPASWFTLGTPNQGGNRLPALVPAGTNFGTAYVVPITFNDSGTDQSACSTDSLTLTVGAAGTTH